MKVDVVLPEAERYMLGIVGPRQDCGMMIYKLSYQLCSVLHNNDNVPDKRLPRSEATGVPSRAVVGHSARTGCQLARCP